MWSPACAISASRPAVFSATVFPPVFGPAMISTRVGGVRRISTGTGPLPRDSGSGLGFEVIHAPFWPLTGCCRAPSFESRVSSPEPRAPSPGISSGCRAARSSKRAVRRHHRLDTADQRREPRACLDQVELGGGVQRAREIGRALPEGVGQREKDAADFLGFRILQRHHVVVDFDRFERLQEERGAAGRRAVDEARNRRRCSALTIST